MTPQLAEDYGAPNTNGAIVSKMTRVSEAYDAGMRPGDVIVGLNGQPIDDASQFLRLVSDAKPGTIAAIKVLRNGKAMEFKLPIVSTSTARTRR